MYVKSLPSLDEYDLKTLSYRLAILLCLTTGQRVQTISYMNLDLMKFETDKVTEKNICTRTIQTNTPRAPPGAYDFNAIQ